MGDTAPFLTHESSFGGGEVDGVCEYGARGEEIVSGVDVCVGGGGREEGGDEGAFGGVFGDVGLDWEVVGGG